MKVTTKKKFSIKSLNPFIVGIVVLLLLEFLIFPALTKANTLLNLLGGGLALAVLVFLFKYVKKREFEISDEITEGGETELDYVNPKEIKIKKKKPKTK